MIHYSKLTRGLMPAKLYAYNDKTDVTISVYQDGDNMDILHGNCRNELHIHCDSQEFMNALFIALEREHKAKQDV